MRTSGVLPLMVVYNSAIVQTIVLIEKNINKDVLNFRPKFNDRLAPTPTKVDCRENDSKRQKKTETKSHSAIESGNHHEEERSIEHIM
ncbi:hypothetical protein DSUL_140006 [Desulfovibrionales bacterium]